MNKKELIEYVANGDPAKCAERLGYDNVQMVYNWPNEFGLRLIKAIKLRMKAARIAIPECWK